MECLAHKKYYQGKVTMDTTKQTTFFCLVILLAGFAAGSNAWTPGAKAACPEFLPGQSLGTLESSMIDEASGMAGSRDNPGVLWMHNDSGDSARVFATDIHGTHLGVYNLSGTGAYDWEDMAVGPGPVANQSYLYLGDIGDNNAVRSTMQVHRVAEPTVSPDQTPVNETIYGVETFTLAYPDGARDAETLLVDPVNGDLYVVSKRETRSRVYRAPCPLSTSGTITMEYKGELPWGWATGGDISPAGDEIIIRGYFTASLWQRPLGTNLWEAFSQTPCSIPLVVEPQGESICFDATGLDYFTVSEGTSQPVYYFERISGRIPGDANRDGVVNEDDAQILAENWGQNGGWAQGDFTLDGIVNALDASILAANWGSSASETTPAPEPGTLATLLGIIGIALLWRRN